MRKPNEGASSQREQGKVCETGLEGDGALWELAMEICNLAHLGWLNKPTDLEYIFTEIEKRGLAIRAALAESRSPAQGELTALQVLMAQLSDLAVELEKHSNDHIHDEIPDNLGAAVEGVCADRINAILKPYRDALATPSSPTQQQTGEPPAQELFKAANTAASNLATAMNLKEHPDSCECYGCGLTQAVVNFALEQAKESTREIREREARAEGRYPAIRPPMERR